MDALRYATALAQEADAELTVVVNSPVLAATLGLKPNLTVLLLGGRLFERFSFHPWSSSSGRRQEKSDREQAAGVAT